MINESDVEFTFEEIVALNIKLKEAELNIDNPDINKQQMKVLQQTDYLKVLQLKLMVDQINLPNEQDQ